jgi:hypothetical protein
LKILSFILMTLMLVSCGSGQVLTLERRHWGDIEVAVEVHPAPLRAGPAEFVIMATDAGTPARDLVVSIRANPHSPWQQAMQDGGLGVFRKSLSLASGQQTLYLQLRNRLEETVLEYPLTVQ